MTELLPTDQEQLDDLDSRKWDLLAELTAIELAKTAILNRIRGLHHGTEPAA